MSNIRNAFFGAGDETRTRDPQLGRLMLYQLSYARKCNSGGGWIRTHSVIDTRFTVWPGSPTPAHPHDSVVLH